MKSIALLANRELKFYLTTMWGYGILAVILFIDGLLFNAFAIGEKPKYSAEVLEQFFYFSSGPTMIAGILLSMRLISEERTKGTDTLIFGAPISSGQIILGKFIGAFAFLSIIILLTCYMPALIFIEGRVSIGSIFVGYIGLLSMGAATVAIGTFCSTLANKQIFVALLGTVLLVFLLLGWLLGKITNPPFDEFFSYIAFFDRHFQPFMRGKINTESLFYFFSITFAFLLLSTQILDSRRQA